MTEVLRVTVGGSDARTVQEKLSRDVGATQVTIDVSYLAITDVDARLHSGELSDLIPSSSTTATTTTTSYVPGHVVCGVVKQVGGAVETLKVEVGGFACLDFLELSTTRTAQRSVWWG